MKNCTKRLFILHLYLIFALYGFTADLSPDLILFNGKVITVDQKFSIAQAVAIKDDKITAVGSNEEIKKLASGETKIIDVKGKTIIPGLNDAHLHPESASVSELDEEIPDVHTIPELLSWIKSQTRIKKTEEWITHKKIFFTRLIELRQPTIAELDSVAPNHKVFLNGTYGGMVNSCALRADKIDKDSTPQGFLKDKNGELTGFVTSSALRYIRPPRIGRPLTYQERLDALEAMLKRYNKLGITSICSGEGGESNLKMYRDLKNANKLTVRVFQNVVVPRNAPKTMEGLVTYLKNLNYVTGTGDEWMRIGALKVVLDGGILTGTAYMREPWGDKAAGIFGITGPLYRGVVNFSREELLAIATAANELNWKFTAHSTGGGGVDLLLDVLEEVNRIKPIAERRFSIIHGNFYSSGAIEKMKRLHVYADMQPAWFYKDADAMKSILGDERLKTFQNYRTLLDAGIMVNGGSDHMVKWDSNTSVNPYNPFQAMWSVITRKTERGNIIIPAESITREEALKMYTINNAYASFEESIKGSVEKGKLADLVVISNDYLTCPVDQIKDILAEMTIIGGKIVYTSGNLSNAN